MPANKLNYIVCYKNDAQVYGSGTKEIALSTPPPPGNSIENKRILFITMNPDTDELEVHKLPQEDVLNAELSIKQKKEKNDG